MTSAAITLGIATRAPVFALMWSGTALKNLWRRRAEEIGAGWKTGSGDGGLGGVPSFAGTYACNHFAGFEFRLGKN
jgi:hypothetical protein